MIRILQVVNDMHRAGLETMLMNYYRNIDRERVQFDFLTHRPEKSDYDDEIVSLGGKVYYAPRLYPQNYPAYFKYMKQFWAQHPEYKIVHSHIDSMSYLPLLTAKKAGVPVRIAHSHNTSIDKDFKYILKQLFRYGINSVANYHLACGSEAGRFLYRNDDFKVIPNAVDAEQFYFNADVRAAKRKELGLTAQFVIGHVGRLSYQKNHGFLLKIFAEIVKKEQNAILLLVGTGEKGQELRALVEQLALNNQVVFLGNRSDVAELYQAMDVFVLPSHFEGIPVVGVEAQFADLPCVFSDKVPSEVAFSAKVCFLPLSDSPEAWANRIIACRGQERSSDRNEIVNSHYDIKTAYKILQDYYLAF